MRFFSWVRIFQLVKYGGAACGLAAGFLVADFFTNYVSATGSDYGADNCTGCTILFIDHRSGHATGHATNDGAFSGTAHAVFLLRGTCARGGTCT